MLAINISWICTLPSSVNSNFTRHLDEFNWVDVEAIWIIYETSSQTNCRDFISKTIENLSIAIIARLILKIDHPRPQTTITQQF